jgi:hypothetical protein
MNGAFPMCLELLQLVWRVVLDGFALYGASICAPHAPANRAKTASARRRRQILARPANRIESQATMEQ